MSVTRRGRLEEIKQKKRLILAIAGMFGLVIFLGLFGFKMLIGFSLFVDMLRGTPPATVQTQKRIFPPVIDPLPIATRSGALRISGSGEPNLTVIVYLDNAEVKKTIVAGNGNFLATLSSVKDGDHVVQAKLSDNKGNASELSEGIRITIKSSEPILEVTTPEDNASVNGENNFIKVEGKTEEDTTVTINGRFVVIRTDNSFSYSYPLSEGENTLVVEAKDMAGNIKKTERKITYHK